MFALKPISHESVTGALAKAERYRLLNEPGEAESICCDILEIEPRNQPALISLLLALTDQISHVEALRFASKSEGAADPFRDLPERGIAVLRKKK